MKPGLMVVREVRLSMFRPSGHVKGREGEGMQGEVMKLEVSGVRPKGHQIKQWKNNIEEDIRETNLRETDAIGRESWIAAIRSSSQVTWRRRC